jgi:alanine racemase
MDYIMCDVTHIPDVQVGDEVILFGKDRFGQEISPQVWADLGGCDVRQFICCLGPRIERVLLFA